MGKVQTEIDIPQVINYQATTVNVGSTTSLPSSSNATVTNVGTETNAILNFGIPKGKSAYDEAVEAGYTGTEQEFKTYMANSANYAAASHTWAEGTDEEVAALGGTHSSQGWAVIAQQATSSKQDISNLVTSISDSSTDTQYPSAKLVYDQLSTKVNTDLSNANDTGTSSSAGWAMPSNIYDDLTLGASGATYQAPANGYFCFFRTQPNSAGYSSLTNTTTGFVTETRNTVVNAGNGVWSPARKGDIVELSYDGGTTLSQWRFYYAEGSKSEAN